MPGAMDLSLDFGSDIAVPRFGWVTLLQGLLQAWLTASAWITMTENVTDVTLVRWLFLGAPVHGGL